MRTRLIAAAFLFLSLAPAVSRANGRYPFANQLVFSRVNDTDLVVRSSFGVLTSHDRGHTMHWICESVAGYGKEQEDPGVGLFADGSIGLAEFEGLSITHDGGCSWAFMGGALDKQYVIDIALDREDSSRGVAITSTGTGSGTFNVVVFETSDNAVTWTPTGPALPTDFLALTVDVAPSDPQRLYASGSIDGGASGAIEISKDRGATWTRAAFDPSAGGNIYIGAVDPTDPDRLYVRAHGTVDTLWVSTDGAQTFTNVMTIEDTMLGFAISPDGSRIALGGTAAGLYTAGRDDLTFSQKSQVPLTCLTWASDGLWACEKGYTCGFTVGLTTDEGATWAPVLADLADIVGPLDTCPADGAFAAACPDEWSTVESPEFGPPGGSPDATPKACAGAATSTTAGGAANGLGGAGGSQAGASGASAAAVSDAGTKSGCGCRAAPAGELAGGSAWLLAFAACLKRRRPSRATRDD